MIGILHSGGHTARVVRFLSTRVNSTFPLTHIFWLFSHSVPLVGNQIISLYGKLIEDICGSKIFCILYNMKTQQRLKIFHVILLLLRIFEGATLDIYTKNYDTLTLKKRQHITPFHIRCLIFIWKTHGLAVSMVCHYCIHPISMHHDLEDSRKHSSVSFSFSRKTYILQDRCVDWEAFEIHRGSSFNETRVFMNKFILSYITNRSRCQILCIVMYLIFCTTPCTDFFLW